MVDVEPKRQIISEKYTDMLMVGTMSRDKLAQALCLSRNDSSALGVDVIQRVLRKAHGTSRITRFTKLWLYYLWATMEGGSDELPDFGGR